MSQIIALEGGLGGGKTFTAVELLKMDLIKHKKIVSTIPLKNIPHFLIYPEDLADFIIQNHTPERLKEIEKVFSYSSLLIDEIRALISSRKSTSNLNEIICQFLMMLGKLDCNCYYTCQKFSMVDIQMREITEWVIKCQRIDKNGNPYTEFRIPYLTPTGEIIPDYLINDFPGSVLFPIFINCKIFEVITCDTLQYTGNEFTYNPLTQDKNYNTKELVIVDREKYLRK